MTRFARPALRFLGAAGTVTGSRYLVAAGSRRILIDCGLFEGFKTLRDRQRKPFPARPADSDTVASGMLTGGRILHHLVSFGGDGRNTVLPSGFQATGTRVAALVNGARSLRTFGRDVAIEAEVVQLQSLSGHAVADAILRWIAAGPAPRMTYLTHGEPAAADTLRQRVARGLGRPVRVPDHPETVQLDSRPVHDPRHSQVRFDRDARAGRRRISGREGG